MKNDDLISLLVHHIPIAMMGLVYVFLWWKDKARYETYARETKERWERLMPKFDAALVELDGYRRKERLEQAAREQEIGKRPLG